MESLQDVPNEAVEALYGGDRQWFDTSEKKFVRFTTLYLPYGDERGGCPDWRGAWKGADITKMPCVFCAIPNAVKEYQNTCNNGAVVSHIDMCNAFADNLARSYRHEPLHTLAIFNGGSFLAMDSLLQQLIIAQVVVSGARRLVIESRAQLVSDEAILNILRELTPHNIKLTVRIGIETQDDRVRAMVLRKGHSRKTLMKAVEILHAHNVTVGGYALAAPAPLSWIKLVHPYLQQYDAWVLQEAIATIDVILDEFAMDEVYFCSTCVAPGTVLEALWQQGEYRPASLSLLAAVLAETVEKHLKPIHLLPFRDEPAFVAVPSNHMQNGVRQDEALLHEHDIWFREIMDQYRSTMNAEAFLRKHAALQYNMRDCTLCRI